MVNSPVSAREMNLRRLLRCCEEAIADTSVLRSKINKIEKFAVELREMLRGLQDTEDSVAPTDKLTLEQYTQRVTVVEMAITREKTMCTKEEGESSIGSRSPQAREMPMEERVHAQRRRERTMRHQLLATSNPSNYSRGSSDPDPTVVEQEQDSTGTVAEARVVSAVDSVATNSTALPTSREALLGRSNEGLRRRGHDGGAVNEWDEDSQATLEESRKRQEELTENILKMTADLKEQHMKIGDSLEKDNKVVDEIDDHLNTNLGRVKGTNATLDKVADGYNRTSIMMFIVLAVVCGVFVFMFVFIRLFPKK